MTWGVRMVMSSGYASWTRDNYLKRREWPTQAEAQGWLDFTRSGHMDMMHGQKVCNEPPVGGSECCATYRLHVEEIK